MTDSKDSCSDPNCDCNAAKREEACQACRAEATFTYWCKSCNRPVSEKRCPHCGLKAQKKKNG
jgi:hypothetical protein